MNRPIRRISVAVLVMFLALLGNITYIQAWQATELNDRPDNRRVIREEYAQQRGPILVGGDPIVRSVATDDTLKYLRTYSKPRMYAPITGYYSSVFGRAMLEQSENDILAGSDNRLFVRRLVDVVTDRPLQGGSVTLTLDPQAQQAAVDGLTGKKGAVVALQPDTGAVLAMASMPSYDPNRLASHDPAGQQKAWNKLVDDPEKPMNNRATQFTYPPGSTFKLITAAAALSSGDFDPETQVPAPDKFELPLTDPPRFLNNWQRGPCVSGADSITLRQALNTSCNSAFAGVGLELGPEALSEQAAKFGFGERFLEELGGAASDVPGDMNEPQTALSAIGQQDVRSTPLQMAMVTAAIANDGDVMEPYIVLRQNAPDLEPLEVTEPTRYGQAISSRTAEQLRSMMVSVVEDGTGSAAKISGVQVGGKTGTAQRGEGQNPYAWYVAFAPADNPQVAVAVVIEEADVGRDEISGSRLAAPIAKAVMEAVIEP